ncbi:MAG: hypothetical protein ACTS4U_01745 [Candidatus Hodgkinia cicadicola]
MWRIVDRISRKMPYGRNLSIKLSQLTSAPFDPKATAVHQLTSPIGSISGLSYAKGVFDAETAFAFSTVTYAP